MSGDDRLERLTSMSALVCEARSAQLRRAAAARDQLQAQLQALERTAPVPEADLALALAAYAYEGWAAARRAEIGLQLAARQADWLTELGRARRAFGRHRLLVERGGSLRPDQ